MTWTDLAAGQTWTAAKANESASYATVVSATKASDTARFSTTTCTADPELSIVLLANRTYEFDARLLVSSEINAAGHFRLRLSWTNTATVTWRCAGLINTLASGVSADWNGQGVANDSTSPTSETSFGASTASTAPRVYGEIVTGGSNVTLTVDWAQFSSNVNDTTLLIGSRLSARRIA